MNQIKADKDRVFPHIYHIQEKHEMMVDKLVKKRGENQSEHVRKAIELYFKKWG